MGYLIGIAEVTHKPTAKHQEISVFRSTLHWFGMYRNLKIKWIFIKSKQLQVMWIHHVTAGILNYNNIHITYAKCVIDDAAIFVRAEK